MEAFCINEKTQANDLMLSECICPICLNILIEPVTLPCDHELCMPCFKRNVEEALFVCPLCRKRIATWARKATKTNKLVNQHKWSKIQQAFPVKVQKRLGGVEDCSSSDEEFDIVTPSISEPGEIREEYLKELRKIEDEQARLRKQEEEASSRLINQLTQEEDQQLRERTLLTEKDEELARAISRNLESDTPPSPATPINSKSKLYESTASIDNFFSRTPKMLSSNLMAVLGNTASSSSVVSGLHTHLASVSESSPDVYSSSRTSSTVGFSGDKLPSLPFMDIKEESCDSDSLGMFINPVLLNSTDSLDAADGRVSISDGVNWIIGDPGLSPGVSPDLSQSDCSSSGPSVRSGHVESTRTVSPSPSEDSITQELVHFKPIHASPRTPPRGGSVKGKDPALIRTTPRRLSLSMRKRSRTVSSSDEVENRLNPDLNLCSPLMKKRLQDLACERQQLVTAHSKSTSTDSGKIYKENQSPGVTRALFSPKEKSAGSDPMDECAASSSSKAAAAALPAPVTPSSVKGKSSMKHPHSISGKSVKRRHKSGKSAGDDPRSSIKGWLMLQAKGVSRTDNEKAEDAVKTHGESVVRSKSARTVDEICRDSNHNQVGLSRQCTLSCDNQQPQCEPSDETDDFLLAQKLQQQFDMEYRFRLGGVRTKEADGEYSLRTRKQETKA